MENQTMYMPFTEAELAILNFSQEELDMIMDAEALRQTTDMLPEEPDALLNRLDKELPNELEGSFNKMAKLANSDPEYTKQLVAMNEIFGEVKPATVEKVSVKAELVKEDIEKLKALLRK